MVVEAYVVEYARFHKGKWVSSSLIGILKSETDDFIVMETKDKTSISINKRYVHNLRKLGKAKWLP